MSDHATPLELTYRPGSPDDWPRVAEIVAETWEEGDYIDEGLWQRWATAPQGYLAVAELDGVLAGFCKLTTFGPAEWWLEGIRVDPALRRRGIARALTAHLLEWFEKHGDGIVRLSTYSQNEASVRLATSFGFRHIISYTAVEARAVPSDFRRFKLLLPNQFDLTYRYLQRSPMYRVNRFTENAWKLYYLTRERLAQYLADEAVQVAGWRQFDQLHGLAILPTKPPDGRMPDPGRLTVGYLDAPDDTTLRAMLRALRGLAAHRGQESVVWKMPTGVGLERVIADAGFERVWDEGGELWLFERPVRQ